MNKIISLLPASILLTTQANAISLQPGDNALALFNTVGSGSYIMDTGVPADAIANGAGFVLDISPAFAALGGHIESFGLIGRTAGTGPAIFNYSEFIYVTQDAGLIYAQSQPAQPGTNTDLLIWAHNLTNYFENVQSSPGLTQGYSPEGFVGDLDSNALIVVALGVGLLNPVFLSTNSNSSLDGHQLFHQFHNSDPNSIQAQQNVPFRLVGSALTLPPCSDELSELAGSEDCNGSSPYYESTFTLNNNNLILAGTLYTPIPAAAWLFISALAGLSAMKRSRLRTSVL